MTPRDRLELVVPEEPVRRQGPVPRARRDPLTFVAVGAIVGILILALIANAAASRAAVDPTSTSSVRDVSGPTTATSGRPLPGAPRTPVAIPAAAGKGLSVSDITASGNPPALEVPLTISGWATYYDAPRSSDAAAGPALRRALGRHWRGSTVQVCASSCVVVRLTDWCACGKRHGIPTVLDLDDQAFASIGKLSSGVIRVRVTIVGQIDVPSTSRPTAPPTDVQR